MLTRGLRGCRGRPLVVLFGMFLFSRTEGKKLVCQLLPQGVRLVLLALQDLQVVTFLLKGRWVKHLQQPAVQAILLKRRCHLSRSLYPEQGISVQREGSNSARFGLGFGELPDTVGGTAFCQLGLFHCLSYCFFLHTSNKNSRQSESHRRLFLCLVALT